MQYKNKKNLYKILFIAILLGFIISLVGCNWLSFGLLNIFDPQAQIRVDYRLDNVTAQGTAEIWFTIFCLNEAEFIGEQFSFEYYVDGVKIPELTRTIGATFYVPPSPLSSFENPVSIPKDGDPGFPVYFQDVIDYMTLHPTIVELNATITVMGTDGAGHSISKTIAFDLPALLPGIDFTPPKASFVVTPGTTGTAPFTVVFDASGSYDNEPGDALIRIASYSWDFGDGTTGSGVMPPAHTYTASGTYFVNLTVTDYFGNFDIALETITVGEAGAPTAVIEVTPSNSGTAPFTVAFDASGSTVDSGCGSCIITNYNWNFGDGSTGTGIAKTHTYVSAGIYVTILTVTDSNGKVGYATVVITVTEPIVGTIIVNANPASNVPGGTSTISAIVTDLEGEVVPNGTTVYFYTNSGALSAPSATTTNGIATVTLTLNASMQDGEKAKVTAFIGAINGFVEITCVEEGSLEAKIITVPDPPTGIAPFEVYFDAHGSSTEVIDYDWDFGDDNTGTGITAENTYTEVGTYTAVLTVTNSSGKKGYDSVDITVVKAPSAKIDTTPAAEDNLIEGDLPFKVYFNAYQSTSESGIVSYGWEFGDGDTGDGITVNHTYNIPGIYIVYLTITDSNGYEAYDSVFVAVGAAGDVNAVIKSTPDAEQPSGTDPFTVGFDASDSTTSASGATIISYTWDFDDGALTVTHSETPPIPVETYTFTPAGTHLVQLTVEDSEGNKGYAFKSIEVTTTP